MPYRCASAIARAKYTPEQELGEFDDIMAEIVAQIAGGSNCGWEVRMLPKEYRTISDIAGGTFNAG